MTRVAATAGRSAHLTPERTSGFQIPDLRCSIPLGQAYPVGYSMDSRMKSSLAVAALENAVRARRPAWLPVSVPALRGIAASSWPDRIDG